MAHGGHGELIRAGVRAPEFTLGRLAGGKISLQEITAVGPAVLAFFKVNCPVCQMTFPFLERIYNAKGLAIYGISQNCPEDTENFSHHFKLTLPMLIDTESSGFSVSNAFGISSVPTLFLVEKDGAISQVSEGWRKQDIAKLGARAGMNPFRPTDSVPEAKAG